MRGNLLAMKPPSLDKNFTSAGTGHNHARNVNARYIAFERLRIAHWTVLLGRKLDADAGKKIVVRVITSERENEIIFQPLRTSGRVEYDEVRPDFHHPTVEVRCDFARFNTV